MSTDFDDSFVDGKEVHQLVFLFQSEENVLPLKVGNQQNYEYGFFIIAMHSMPLYVKYAKLFLSLKARNLHLDLSFKYLK